jgi:hypothetical protein
MARLPGNSDSAWLDRMLVLPMASSGGDQVPAVGLDHLDDLTDL